MSLDPSRMAILVISCDNYADLWSPFYALFWRFWPSCPFTVYHVSNYHEISEQGVVSLAIGEDHSWSDNVIKALAQVQEEYVLMMIDDLFLTAPPLHDELDQVFTWVGREKPNYLRLNPVPYPDITCNSIVGGVSPGTLYRTGTVFSVWRKEVLIDLLRPGESAWDFEIKGTIRSDRWDRFYSTRKSLFPFVNGVIKGKWRRSAIRKLRSFGVNPNLDARKVMTITDTLRFSFQIMRSWALRRIPSRCRRSVKTIFSRTGAGYSLLK